MNITKKLLVTSAICFQIIDPVRASGQQFSFNVVNYSQAFQTFSHLSDLSDAATAIFNHRNSMPWTSALQVAQQIGTPEAFAVGLYVSRGNPNVVEKKFPKADSAANLQAALQYFMNGSVTKSNAPSQASQPVEQKQSKAYIEAMIDQAVQSAQEEDQMSLQAAVRSAQEADLAALQAAVQSAQKADAAAQAGQNQALQALVNNSSTGMALFQPYIDLIYNNLTQALSSIADPALQQSAVQYANSKFANISVSVKPAQASQNILGTMGSKKKGTKKNKNF